jgi:hypothetical protein
MRTAFLMILSLVLIPQIASAADDFGQRFGNTAPSALEDEMTPEELQAIAPAAGTTAEQTVIEQAIDPVIETVPQTPGQSATPIEDIETPAN